MAAAAKCKVLCKVDYDYTPSVPITSSTAIFKYRVKDPFNPSAPYTEYTQTPAPLDGVEVSIPNVFSAEEYELIVELTVNGATDKKEVSFNLEKCDTTSACKKPLIDEVYLGANDQIIMKYIVDNNDLYAVEYQIATDNQFNDIVHFRVLMGADYNPIEYIEMNDGTILNDTNYHIRVRKHCSSSDVSAWSDIMRFKSGKWNVRKLLDAFWLANGDDLSPDICDAADKYAWKTKVTLSADNPTGSVIYLTNGMPATIDNIKDLAQNTSIPVKFQENGIRWIRFSNVTPTLIYNVDTTTAKIGDPVDNLKCPAS